MENTKRINAKVTYKLRGDTLENWQPTTILSEREPGLVLDANGKTIGFKIGDGVTPWDELEYHSINTTQVNTDLANAYKATIAGTVVKVDDASPLEHELRIKLKSDTVTDFSAVKVSRYGKNLFSIAKDKLLDSIGNFTFDSEGVYGNYGSGASNYVMFSTQYPVGTYSFSAQFSHKGEIGSQSRIIVRCFDTDGNILTSGLSNYNDFYKAFILPLDDSITFTIPNTAAYWCIGWVPIAETLYGVSSMKFPQLELGASVTAYEPYKMQTVTADAEGTVEGITSVAPIMMLTTDAEAVTIECEYNKDINKVSFGKNVSVDQEFNPESENAQSGIAVAGAVSSALCSVANAYKQTVQGTSVCLTDVSPLAHNVDLKLSSLLTQSTFITVFGKNILDGFVRQETDTNKGISIRYDPLDDCYVLNGTAEATGGYYKCYTDAVPCGAQTICCTIEPLAGSVTVPDGSPDTAIRFTVAYTQTNASATLYDIPLPRDGKIHSKTSWSKAEALYYTQFYLTKGTTFNNYRIRIQVEVGDAPTSYMCCSRMTYDVPPLTRDTKVTAIAPTTHILTDKNVQMQCTYNKDIQAILNQIIAALTSLGANI